MPFEADSFDLIVCQAAFKTFARPGRALDAMHRVLRGGGTALIQDLRREASPADIDREVRGTALGRPSASLTKWTLATLLRRRAYSRARCAHLAAASAFRTCDIRAEGIGMEVRPTKRVAA